MNANPSKNLHDQDAEAAVLGGILLRPEILVTLPKLEPGDFFNPHHGHVFAAMRNLEAKQVPIDLVTVGAELGPKAEAIGWPGLGGMLALRVPTPENVEHYARTLRDHRVKRDVMRRCGDAIASLAGGEVDGVEAVGGLMADLQRIESGEDEDAKVKTFGQLVREEFSAIESDVAARRRGEFARSGMPTGLTNLDKKTGGPPFGLMTIVAARPGMGKTTLMMRLSWAAWHLAEDEPIVASYEDGGRSFAQRLIAQQSGVQTEVVRAREFERCHLDSIQRGVKQMFERGDLLVAAAGMPVEELCRRVRAIRRKATGKLGSKRTRGRLVCVDFIQRIPLPRMQGSKNDRVGEISKRLVDLAATEDVALVVGSQLNREIEKRAGGVPQLSDLRDSGELEADAKFVIAPHREGPHSSRLDLHVLKNHNGEANVIAEAFWHLPTHTICNSAADLPWLQGR